MGTFGFPASGPPRNPQQAAPRKRCAALDKPRQSYDLHDRATWMGEQKACELTSQYGWPCGAKLQRLGDLGRVGAWRYRVSRSKGPRSCKTSFSMTGGMWQQASGQKTIAMTCKPQACSWLICVFLCLDRNSAVSNIHQALVRAPPSYLSNELRTRRLLLTGEV